MARRVQLMEDDESPNTPKRKRPTKDWVWLLASAFVLVIFAAAVVLVVAEFTHHDRSKGNLDVRALTFQARNLREALSKQPELDASSVEDGQHPTFRDLVFALYDTQAIDLQTVKGLAGASGIQEVDETYAAAERHKMLKPRDTIIFTGPADYATLRRLLFNPDPRRDGVLFTYNSEWMEYYREQGIVVLFAGDSEAQCMTLEEIEEHWYEVSGQRVELVGKSASEIFGRPPFHNISPE